MSPKLGNIKRKSFLLKLTKAELYLLLTFLVFVILVICLSQKFRNICLNYCFAHNYYHAAVILIKLGADVNNDEQIQYGNDLLTCTIKNNSQQMASLLVAHHYSSMLLSVFDAINFNNYSMANYFIKHGGAVNFGFGSTRMLEYYVQHNNFSAVQYLVNHGADVNQTEDRGIGAYGSALMAASALGYKNIALYLIRHGAIIGLKNNLHESAIMMALHHHHRNLARIMTQLLNQHNLHLFIEHKSKP